MLRTSAPIARTLTDKPATHDAPPGYVHAAGGILTRPDTNAPLLTEVAKLFNLQNGLSMDSAGQLGDTMECIRSSGEREKESCASANGSKFVDL